jgi:hypothetical protein
MADDGVGTGLCFWERRLHCVCSAKPQLWSNKNANQEGNADTMKTDVPVNFEAVDGQTAVSGAEPVLFIFHLIFAAWRLGVMKNLSRKDAKEQLNACDPQLRAKCRGY